jgi:RES domain-containing protein
LDDTSVLPPARKIIWAKTYRIVPNRYPPIDLFERISDPADWETLAAIDGITNERLRDQIGNISAVPIDERISGPGASPIMAAFTHTGFPSRFTDGTYGVYYASDRIEAALHEVAFHQARFLRRTNEPKARLEMRTYVGSLACTLCDVRGGWSQIHDPDDYGAAQKLGAIVRAAGRNGIVYDAVRMAGASNLAAFRPKAVASSITTKAHVIQGPHFFMSWNGTTIDRYLQVEERAGEARWRPL